MTSKTHNRDFVSVIAFCWLCTDEIKTTFQAFEEVAPELFLFISRSCMIWPVQTKVTSLSFPLNEKYADPATHTYAKFYLTLATYFICFKEKNQNVTGEQSVVNIPLHYSSSVSSAAVSLICFDLSWES